MINKNIPTIPNHGNVGNEYVRIPNFDLYIAQAKVKTFQPCNQKPQNLKEKGQSYYGTIVAHNSMDRNWYSGTNYLFVFTKLRLKIDQWYRFKCDLSLRKENGFDKNGKKLYALSMVCNIMEATEIQKPIFVSRKGMSDEEILRRAEEIIKAKKAKNITEVVENQADRTNQGLAEITFTPDETLGK